MIEPRLARTCLKSVVETMKFTFNQVNKQKLRQSQPIIP